MSLSIDIKQLTKQFGEVIALRHFSGTINQGDRICVLGHNGAGKSTLLSLLSTLAKPSFGTIRFSDNGRTLSNRLEIRKRIAFLSHESMLYPDLTALENLRFVARMTGQPHTREVLLEVLDRVGMRHTANRLFRTFSRGMQQRVSLARALLANPELLLLDEPFSGLDHQGVLQLKSLFTSPKTSWVLVTHHFHLGYELANRIWILRRGKLLHQLDRDQISFQDYLALCQQAGDAP